MIIPVELDELLSNWPHDEADPVLRERYRGYTGWHSVEEHLEWDADNAVITLPGMLITLVECALVRVIGDGESPRELILRVQHSDDTVQHFRKNGRHASYDGTSWDGPFEEVTAAQKTINIWEAA